VKQRNELIVNFLTGKVVICSKLKKISGLKVKIILFCMQFIFCKGKLIFYCGILFFLSFSISFAQSTDIKQLETKFQVAPTPALVAALNKAYQEKAFWFCKTPQFNSDSTIFYFDKAVVLLENAKPVPNDLLAELYKNLCEFRIKRSEYSIALEMGQKALSYLLKIPPSKIDKLLHYHILWNIAYAKLTTEDTKGGLDVFNQSVLLLQQDKRPEIQALVLKNTGIFYTKYYGGISVVSPKGLNALLQSVRYYENSDKINAGDLFIIYEKLMWYYNVRWGEDKTQLIADSCDYYFSKMYALLPQLKDPILENTYYSHRANVMLRRGLYEEALVLIQQSFNIIDKYHLEFDRLYPFNFNLLGYIAYKKKQWAQAESYFKQARDISLKQKNPRSEQTYLTHILNMSLEMGDLRRAIEVQDMYYQKMIELREERSNKNLKESELQLNVLLQEKELIQKNAERNLLLAAILIVLILLGLFVFIFIRERRSKAILEKQNHIIEEQSLALRQLDAAKNRFFTNITHEFRTPLTVILGMSEQLTRDEPVETKRNKLGLIRRSGGNLLRLINQILDLAKLESNTLKMNYIQGDILNYIRYIAESLHSLANSQNLMLRVESDQAIIMMDYDPERFLQIIHNLLSNAVKFTPSGGKVILRVNQEGAWLNIAVVDSGVGIPVEEQAHLFERFFQAKNQEHSKAGGTGIGLSFTYELVKAMGGDISVESTVGVGSTFLVKLPVTNNEDFVEKGSDAGLENLKTSIANPQTRPATPQQKTDDSLPQILLVEDNPDVVEYLTNCLDGHFQLHFAYNGRAGIEKALETVPDIIISDVMMPEKDGFEVVEALKNDERSSHVPIILLTAKADVESRIKGLRRGADAYLSKPFHEEELLVTLENLLELRRKLQLKYQQKALTSDTASLPAAADPEDSFLQKVRNIVETNYQEESFGLPQLCQKVGMSRSQLFRKMKALTDIAPSDLIRKHRLNKAKTLLESGSANVAEATWQVGFKDASYFSKLYQEEFGEAPSTTRK
jgi:signal transduction histidine kinase/DNA-binding response OmpR family regulator